ncbi:unnamed protein product [Porites evermanni]|uniref:JmjC domain-containing protein n=1 Tax=Porites evermanni TaxID=104178 RepID=A0ABN8M3U0_9CNID|nr:unnamed protein product [Porites evermanni]
MTSSNMADERDLDVNKAKLREVERTSLASDYDPEKLRINFLNRTKPVVFHGAASLWPCSRWSPEFLASELGDLRTKFRFCVREKSPSNENGFKRAIMETECEFEEATFLEFVQWVNGFSEKSGLLSRFQRNSYWCYADYKYMAELFRDFPHLRQSVKWDSFGFPQRSGDESTIWIGSAEASTPCHFDTYGCNLVAQIYGQKKWTLFPPEETPKLYPTRIPYEESSVFSQVNIDNPDLSRFPSFASAVQYEVTLDPGDVLFVPKKWWHYVQSLDTSISINTWIELESDHIERVREAIIRTLVCALKNEEGADESVWVNPSEDIGTYRQNMEYLHQALSAVKQKEHENAERTAENIKEPLCNLEEAQQRVLNEYKDELCTDDLIHCITTPDVVDLLMEKLLGKFRISQMCSLPLKSSPGDEKVCSMDKIPFSTISSEGGDLHKTSVGQEVEKHLPCKRKCIDK